MSPKKRTPMTSLTAKWLSQFHKLPEGPVLEFLELDPLPVDGGENVPGRDVPLLDRSLGGGRGKPPFSFLGDGCGISYRPHVPQPWNPQKLADDNPVAFGEWEVEILELDVRADT